MFLFEPIDKPHGIASVFWRVGKDVSSVIVELYRPESKVGIQVIVHAAAECPGRAGITGADVGAEMGNAHQSMDKEVQLVRAMHELRAEQDVVLAGANAIGRFVIAAEIRLQAEPITQIAGERGLPSAAVGECVTVEQRVTQEDVTRRTFMAHATSPLGPAADRKKKKHENEERFAHLSACLLEMFEHLL